MEAVISVPAELPSSSTAPFCRPSPPPALACYALREMPSQNQSIWYSLLSDAKHSFLKRGKDIDDPWHGYPCQGYGVDIDLTPQQREERTLMNPIVNNLKAQGATPFF